MVETRVRSDAFSIEYKTNIPEKVLYDDIVSYLGEYRFNLQKYSYNLTFKDGKLRDPHRNDAMEDLAQRAIEKKACLGRPSEREKAEREGFRNLDAQLKQAEDKDTLIWASPPGPKEEGYGDYGFIFVGKVDNLNFSEKKINMIAIRVENPTLSQFNRAVCFLTGEKVERKAPEDFLRNPKIVKEDLKEGYVDAILGMSFDFKPKKDEKEKFIKIIQRINPLIKDFASIMRTGSDGEKIKALNAIENYCLKIKEDYEDNRQTNFAVKEIDLRLGGIIKDYGYKPPTVKGSCGSSSSTSNLFNKLTQSISSLGENQEWFVCPKCSYKADGPVGNTCPKCGLTKEEYAEETGITCE
jgi:hypothetical protein